MPCTPLSSTLAVLAIALLPAHATAQSRLYARAGATVATIAGDDAGETQSRTGFSIAGAVLLDLTPTMGLQLGGSYVQKGAVAPDQGFETSIMIDYVELPALLHWTLPTAAAFSPHLVVGPAVSMKVGCKVRVSSQGFAATVGCDDGGLPVQSIDIGAMGGAGLDIATAGSMSVTLDVLYNFGFRSVDGTTASEDVKNRAWYFLAGAALPL